MMTRDPHATDQQQAQPQSQSDVLDVEATHYAELFGVDSQTAATWDRLYEDRPNSAGDPMFGRSGYSHNRMIAQDRMMKMQQSNPSLKFSDTIVEHKMAAASLMEQIRSTRSARTKVNQPSAPVVEPMGFQY